MREQTHKPLAEMTADELLVLVHKQIGLGIDIQTFSETNTVEISWKRDYGDEGWSDLRPVAIAEGENALAKALRQVLEYEDEADRMDAEEEALANG